MDDNGSAFCGNATCLFGKSRLIPPHQSLTRQLPPKGKPWNKTRFMAYNYLNSEKSKAFFLKKHSVQKAFAKGSLWIKAVSWIITS